MVGSIKYRLAVAQQDNLRGLVRNPKIFRDLVGNRAVGDQVEVIKVEHIGAEIPCALQPELGMCADPTAGTVFEDDHRLPVRGLPQLIYLLRLVQDFPVLKYGF